MYLPKNIDEEEMGKIIDDRIGIRIHDMMNILLIHGQLKPAGLLNVAARLPKSQIRNPDEPHTFFRLEAEVMLRFETFMDKFGIHWSKKEVKSDDHRRTRRHPDGWVIYERDQYDYFIGQDTSSLQSLITANRTPHSENPQEIGIALGFPEDAVEEFTDEINENVNDWKSGEDWELYVWWMPAAEITSSRQLATAWRLYARENYPRFADEYEVYTRQQLQ